MPIAKRHVQYAIITLGGLVALATALVAIRGPRSVDPPLPVPNVPPSTSRDGAPKADETLSKLKPGMLRGDVEALLGPPSEVESIRSGSGKLSYRATFTRDRFRPPLPPLTLEFDATQPGHPLLMAKPM